MCELEVTRTLWSSAGLISTYIIVGKPLKPRLVPGGTVNFGVIINYMKGIIFDFSNTKIFILVEPKKCCIPYLLLRLVSILVITALE